MKKFLWFITALFSVFSIISCASSSQNGMNEKAMFVLIYDGSNTGLGNVRVYAQENGKNTKDYLGSSDMNGRFYMALKENCNYTLTLEKDGYETSSKEFEFRGMTGLYFRMLTVDDLLSEAEQALDLHNYSKALSYSKRALKLDGTRKDSVLLNKIILKHIENNGGKNE